MSFLRTLLMFVFLFSLMGDGVSYAGIISNCSNCGGEGKAVNYGRSINIPEKARPNDATISSYQIRRNNWLLRKSNQGLLYVVEPKGNAIDFRYEPNKKSLILEKQLSLLKENFYVFYDSKM